MSEEKKRKPTIKQDKFVEGVLQHGNATKAALDAGYSPKTAYSIAGENLKKPEIAARIQARIAESQVDSNEVIGTLVSHMRGNLADIVPKDELLQDAQLAGVSHLIKKIKTHTRYIPQKGHDEEGNPLPAIREVTREFEMYSAQEAAKQLASILGIVKEPAPNKPRDIAQEILDMKKNPRYANVSIERLIEIASEATGIDATELANNQVNGNCSGCDRW